MDSDHNESNEEPETKESLKRPITNVEEDGPSEKKKKKLNFPSVKELTEMNESTRSIKSFFTLQTQELLEETKISNKLKKGLSGWLEEFQKFQNADKIFTTSNESKLFKKIEKQLKNKIFCDQEVCVKFVKPESIGTFGLYKINALPNCNIETNIHVTIPKKFLNVKDYLNNRYFVKKYFYLMYIAEYLKSQNMCSSIKCAYYNENVLLPYLVLCPSNLKKVTINLFAIPEQNYFKGTRYSPDVNNIKAQVFKKEIGEISNIGELPTTFYNAALAYDVSLVENNVFVENLFSTSNNIQEGIKLIIIWMNRRKIMGSSTYSIDIIIYIMAYLVSKGNINQIMTPEQVFRNFLHFILTTDLTKTPLSISNDLSEEELMKYKSAFDIVLMDKTGYYNTTSFLHLNTYLKIRHECKLAMNILDQPESTNSFANLFLTDVPVYLQYGAIITVKCKNEYESILEKVNQEDKAKYAGNYTSLIVKILLEYLNKGFNQRLKNIVPIIPCTQWDIEENNKKSLCEIIFGIELNLDTAYEIIEFGPSLLDPEEKNFKEFWGELTSNRRFRDGTAKIVVFFDTKTIKERRDIIKIITNYVLHEKLKLNYKLTFNEFEEVAVNHNVETWYPSGTNEETSLKISKSSDALGQKIRNLKIELGVTGIGGISDVYCYTNVFPPIPSSHTCNKKLTELKGNKIILKNKTFTACPRFVEPVECVIQLSHSSKWPGTLTEIHDKKRQFLELFSSLLEKQYNIVSSVKYPNLDIIYEGIVFRYNLYVSKEIALYRRLEEETDSSEVNKDDGYSFELDKKLIVIPKIVGALKGIHAQYPSYGVSTCIAKRWIRAQLIDDFLLPDIVIDLLNAHQFVHKTLYEPAVTPQSAFLRFLKFLVEAQWDWQPIVINFNEILSADKIAEVNNDMDKNRENYPDLFILTPYDDSKSIFTKKAPCKQVLNRLKILAKEFLRNFEENVIVDPNYNWKALFLPNTEGFNCVLNLKHLLNSRRHEDIHLGINETKKIFEPPSENYLPVIKFNPVDIYLQKLREIYGDICIFFHDTYGGCFIGVLWKTNMDLDVENIKKGFEIFGKRYNVLKSIT